MSKLTVARKAPAGSPALTTEQAAERLQLSPAAMRRWLRKAGFPELAKTTVGRTPPQADITRAVPDLDLEIALSKARAASILLKADTDYLQIPVPDLKPTEERDVRSWIAGFAHDALDAALEEAEAARRKIQGAPFFGSTRKVVAR